MTRFRASIAALLFGALLATCTPAHAVDGVDGGVPVVEPAPGPVQVQGDRTWSATACWSQPPVNGMWFGVPGQGAHYASAYARNLGNGNAMYRSDLGMHVFYIWVGHEWHDKFAQLRYECGFGFPIDLARRYVGDALNGTDLQYFYNPYRPCDLMYLFRFVRGGTLGPLQWSYVPNYFC